MRAEKRVLVFKRDQGSMGWPLRDRVEKTFHGVKTRRLSCKEKSSWRSDQSRRSSFGNGKEASLLISSKNIQQ